MAPEREEERMSRSRSYQKSRTPWGNAIKYMTARNARAHQRMNIVMILKDVENFDDIVFYDYKRYDDHWNYD